ncbi:DNA repair protein RecN [Thalassotalea piscium]|uniref:DNA repair protein RecN n=1 Tax=Thalassotalea piscium TaxID=1230533 RepID=A0A7X0NJD1_9GAMM|nr:DNA repair protein RecN [Thalassotalea piscium]MBB6544552.1 DNA repair protein RecN (Recombination protein N) [Thalassotalea piscium]
MLLQLNIQNFAIVRSLDIDWQQGMTTITGETGAGKSIAIDALGLCLGDRAVTNVVRPNCKKAELAATFDVSKNPKALKWLTHHDLLLDNECILRRVISAEGRSKAYINGSQVPLAQLKEMGQLLINIHGQHDHQLITKAVEQRNILDQYATHHDLIENVKHYYNKHKELTREYDLLLESKIQRDAKQQLLQYQVNELNEFSIQQGEFESLEIEYTKQSNGQHILNQALQTLQILSDDEQFNVVDQLRRIAEQLSQLSVLDKSLTPLVEQVNSALIQTEDAASELTHYYERLELDPQGYQVIEERYSQIIQLAKKHQITPESLFELHQQLNLELQQMGADESRLAIVADEIEQAKLAYLNAAEQLSDSRTKSANKLSKLISASMNELNMPHGKFAINVNANPSDKISTSGYDNVEFLVSLNPGQALEAMNKVASGGELSRISLAMQVILSAKVITPTLIFDEVDVGISGPTATMVGKKLQQLAHSTQVICVTHLPQVASKGRQQLFVAKLTDGEHTETTVTELSEQGRVQEIARLLAGDKITDNSLANAQELLAG